MTPRPAKTLNIAFFGDNTTLVSVDPFQVYWLEHRVLLRNVAESLTDQDPETGKIIPWLAKSWEVSDDALTYTFHLRDNVTFSNGERFNAVAVKTAFDSDKALATELPATFGATYLAGYDHAEVVDDLTVKLVLAKPNAGFLQATSTTNLSILAPASYTLSAKERSLGKIIGTGPFVLASYTPEVGAHLTKRKGYAWASANMKNQGEAHLDAVDISYIPEESVRNGLFLQGKADILWPRNPFSEVDLKLFQSKGATIQSRSLPGPALNLYPNTRDGRALERQASPPGPAKGHRPQELRQHRLQRRISGGGRHLRRHYALFQEPGCQVRLRPGRRRAACWTRPAGPGARTATARKTASA